MAGKFSVANQPKLRRMSEVKPAPRLQVVGQFTITSEEMHTAWQSLTLCVAWFDEESKLGNPAPPDVRNNYQRLANKIADLLTLEKVGSKTGTKN